MFQLKTNMLGLVSKKLFAPYPIARGSFQQRMAKAREYNQVFFENIKDSFKDREITPAVYLKKLKEILPAGIHAEICNLQDYKDFSSNSMIYLKTDQSNRFCTYQIVVPFNYYSNNIQINTTGTFMHENQHLFDFMLNPKILKRRVNLVNSSQNPSDYLDYYIHKIYTKKNFSRKDLKNFLKNKPLDEQINFLQFCRYQLYTEYNAFKNTNKYQHQIENIYSKEISYKEQPAKYGKFRFNTKIKYIETFLGGIIQSVRERFALLNNKNSVL